MPAFVMRTSTGFVAAACWGAVVSGQTTTTSTPLACEDQNVDDTMSCNEALANSGITTCLEAEEYMPNCAHCICAEDYVPPDIDYACAASCNTIYLQDDVDFCRDSSGGACCSADDVDDPFFFTNPDTQSRTCFCSFDASGSTDACAANEKRTMSFFLCNNATTTFLNEAIEGPCTVIMDEGCCDDRSHRSAFDDPYSGEQACWCNGYNSPTCEGVWTAWSECKQGHQSRAWTYTQTKGTNGCELTHDDFDFRQCTVESTTTLATTTTTVACSQENPVNGDYFYCVALGTCLRHSDYSKCITTTSTATSTATTTTPLTSGSTGPKTSQSAEASLPTVVSTTTPNTELTLLGQSTGATKTVSSSGMQISLSNAQTSNPIRRSSPLTVDTGGSTAPSTAGPPSTTAPPSTTGTTTTTNSPPTTGGTGPTTTTLANLPSTEEEGSSTLTISATSPPGATSSEGADVTTRTAAPATTATTALVEPSSVAHSEPTEQPPITDQWPTTGRSTTGPYLTNTDPQYEDNTPMVAGIVVAVVIVAIIVVVVVVVQKNKQRDRHVNVRQSSYVPPASAASGGGGGGSRQQRGGAIPRYSQSKSVATAFASSEDDGGDSVFGVDSSSDSDDVDFDDVAVGIGGDTTGNFSDSEFSA